MKGLTHIILLSNKADASEALGYRTKLDNFKFIVMLELFRLIFSSIGPLTKYLQNPSINMMDDSTKINTAAQYVTQLRGEFADIKEAATELAYTWKVKSNIQDKRIRRVPQRLGELSQDEPIEDAEKYFGCVIFFPILDHLGIDWMNVLYH